MINFVIYIRGMKYPKRKCEMCGEKKVISKVVRYCVDCIRSGNEDIMKWAVEIRKKSRGRFGLPVEIPKTSGGIKCTICGNECIIGEGEVGFCGLRTVRNEKMVHISTPKKGVVEYYYDSLPTNCVAEYVCAGCTGAGHPKYARRKNSPEYGYNNLAVFYSACNLDCLYCQNWSYRLRWNKQTYSAKELAAAAHSKKNVGCICYFGGDPGPQMPHSLATSKYAIESSEDIMRVCWETNGFMAESFIKKAFEISLQSGGCIKFDLKFSHENLYKMISFVDGKVTKRNFRILGKMFDKRPVPPPIVASTCVVPGYVDEKEIEEIASFIAEINEEIPYVLLAFHPQFMMKDLTTTSYKHIKRCKEVAEEASLRNVHIGNIHLLW